MKPWNVPRPQGRDLSGLELQRFVDQLADCPELWIDFVSHDPDVRVYRELLSDAHLTAWLICWMEDHDTGFHDHDISAGAVAVVSGRVCEERMRIDGPPRERTLTAGESLHFSAADIHRVRAFMDERGKRVPIMAKIEKRSALEQLEPILDLCDGLMVARGDLGVEMEPEDVPVAQKMILRAARRRGARPSPAC